MAFVVKTILRLREQTVICEKLQPMDRKYWEKIAPAYNEEIFDVLHHDRKGLIRSAIASISSRKNSVIDIGCAVGKWLPVLAPAFSKVMAIDISAGNIAIARRSYSHLSNVSYKRADMSAGRTSFKNYDAAVCINAILTDSLTKRTSFFQNIATSLKKNGHLVLVVPSLESKLLTRIIQHQWKIDHKLFSGKMSDKEGHKRYNHVLQGNFEIDDVPTKHYLEEELQLLLTQAGFQVKAIEKINYDWSTEFVDAPTWLKEPYPWDWMVVARKK